MLVGVRTCGGSGKGRELVRQLAAEGRAITMCNVSTRGMAETRRLYEVTGQSTPPTPRRRASPRC